MSALSCCGSGKCNSFLPTALLLSFLFAPLLSCSDGESDRRSRLRADKQTSSNPVTIQTTLSFPEGNVVPGGSPPVSLPEIIIAAFSKNGTYGDLNAVADPSQAEVDEMVLFKCYLSAGSDPGAQPAGVSGCSSSQWPDANQCSGWYSAGGQKGVKYESGTTKCKYGCCIQLTCGN